MATIKKIAQSVGMDPRLVGDVLKEVPGVTVPKETVDKIFGAARRLGYDLRKLKLGKRMQVRKETIEEFLKKIEANPSWSRDEIVKFMRETLAMVERVHRRVYPEEFGG